MKSMRWISEYPNIRFTDVSADRYEWMDEWIDGRADGRTDRQAYLTRRFKLFSVNSERNFKKYINYNALCFKFTLKLTKISTKYIYICI